MPRIHPLSPSFNAGELSPRLAARTDFSKFSSGLETCVNLIPLAEGGLMRRSGSRYVVSEKSASVKGRLKGFEFSVTQAYMLEFGSGIIRFMRHQGQITAVNITASITNGTFTSNITNWTDQSGAGSSISHDSTNGRLNLISNGTTNGHAEQQVTNASAIDHTLKFRIIGAPGDEVTIQIGTSSTGTEIASIKRTTGYHVYTFTATAADFYVQFLNVATAKTVQIDDVSLIDNAAVEVDSPYAEADLFQVDGPQSADVLYLFHESYPTHKLERFAHDSWSLTEVLWEDGPYLDLNETSTTMTPAATTGLGINVTASSTTGVNGGQGFLSTDIGRSIRIDNPASGIAWGWAVIVSITSTTVAVVDIKADFSTTNADARWKLGMWSGTTGYPSVGEFYEQRLFAAGNTDNPQTFSASQTADFQNMTPDNREDTNDETVEADDSFTYTISADNVNAIRWMSAGDDTLAIGTTGGEWVPSSQGAVLAPDDVTVRRQTTAGAAQVQPVRVNDAVLFVQRAGRKVREFAFSFDIDGYKAQDMTRLAQHIGVGGIDQMAWAPEPDSLVWAVRDDGQLLSMTYRRDEDVVGWARHVLGGFFHTSMTEVWQVDDSTPTYTDETTDANSAADADWTVFPGTEAAGDYVAIGFTRKFTRVVFDYANGTAGVGGAVTWEYWNGTAWAALSNVTDGTSGFTTAAADNLAVYWDMPSSWMKRVVGTGQALYFVRARITTVYTTNPIFDQGFIADNPVVESVATIPGADGAGQTQSSADRDEVWVSVKRTVNGATARYIEVLERDFEDGDAQEDSYYVDSCITYDSTATTSITGLTHLEGEVVKVLADGAAHADKTVSSGAITLDSSAKVVQVGLGYAHTMKTLKMEVGNPAGTAVGKTKRIYAVTFVLLNSHTITYGPKSDNVQTKEFRVVSDPMDTAAPFFTGEVAVRFPGGWDPDARIVIESDDPVPFMLLAMAPEVALNPLK